MAAVDDVAVELFNSATWSCRLLSAARILSWQEVASDPDPARAGDPSKIQYILDVHHMYMLRPNLKLLTRFKTGRPNLKRVNPFPSRSTGFKTG